MSTCPTCRIPFEGDAQFCPRDGTPLLPPPPADPLVGTTLGGRYRLSERLGQGGMGTVYRGVHTLMDKPVAVKVLRGDHAREPEAVARFRREARSASRLDQENCIRVTDFGQSDQGLMYLVMELLDGESLGDRLRAGALAGPRAAWIARSIALALQHAHEQGVVHRDLKPDNVFLARRGRREVVKVLDFGLARIIGPDASVGGTRGSGPSITQAGVVFGTPEYMAPEQAEGGPVDARTDLYALGAVLYHLLTGHVPFTADNYLTLLSKQVEELPLPPRQRRPDLEIPEALETIALRCLEKVPAARFQTAAEVALALLPLSEAPSPSSSQPVAAIAPPAAVEPTAAEPVVRPPLLPDPPASVGGIVSGNRDEPPLHEAAPTISPSLGIEALGPARVRRRAYLVAGIALLGLCSAWALGFLRSRSAAPMGDAIAATAGPIPAPLQAARHALAAGDLEGADRILAGERERGDGAEVQELLGEAALLRGNRLGAMAHYHRATRLAPALPEPHARLASLLALLGQREPACKEAHVALVQDRHNSLARAAAAAAHCPLEAAPGRESP